MTALPPLTFQGNKAVFDMGSGQKVYMEVTTLSVKDFFNNTVNPYIEQFTMVHRWLTQPSRGYTLQSLSQSSTQRTAYAAATYTITVSV